MEAAGARSTDAAKLAALGNLDEVYEPAYVEDLDVGYRAWPAGMAERLLSRGAVVEHRHRATTSRYYYTPRRSSNRSWSAIICDLCRAPYPARPCSGGCGDRRCAACSCAKGLWHLAAPIALAGSRAHRVSADEDLFLALKSGAVSVFPGRAATVNRAS